MQPPESFARMLEVLDPLLSVRWGEHVQQWVVERKCVTPPHEMRWLLKERELDERDRRIAARNGDKITLEQELDFQRLNEEIVSLRAGKRVLVHAAELTPAIRDRLFLADITRAGGYSRFADEKERIKDAKRAKVREKIRAKLDDMNREVFGTDHSRGLYDFLTDKTRTSALDAWLTGRKTLNETLGLKKDEKVLGRGGASKIVDERGRAFSA